MIYTLDTIEPASREFNALKFPYVNPIVWKGLGITTILVSISMSPRDTWPYGYIENTPYAKIEIEPNGTVQQISGHRLKLRKFTAKSIPDAVQKINERIKVVEP